MGLQWCHHEPWCSILPGARASSHGLGSVGSSPDNPSLGNGSRGNLHQEEAFASEGEAENFLLNCSYFIDAYIFNPGKISSSVYLFMAGVKINQTTGKSYLFRTCYIYIARELGTIACLGRDFKVGRCVRTLQNGTKRRLPRQPNWGLWPRWAGGRLTQCRASCVVGRGACVLCLVPSWKQGQNLQKPSVINQVLGVGGPSVQS